MGFGGSAAAMITSLKNNKRTRVSTFKKMKDFKEGKNIQVSFSKKSTPAQLKRIREKLQSENRKRLRRFAIISTCLLIIVIYVIGFVKF
ncbi:hypothetical protein KO506_02410 [Polaribacter vadi]|uniref:hypothetical protein n=1 Tax=Polaribacter TaxID=52959 RepID=UPI001C08C8FB|nr:MULTISPECIES: hypothetical protein [Polaribacter]MBU3010245.1 hypothetical protein [Polaribacter vadi]MDO6740051.1 hypothetical protein [Polaribacter sp. 1_MG-2023]